jgi:heme/copper-type cytochrome/quinol oxidase subunit 3
MTVALGSSFLAVKAFEYGDTIAAGLLPSSHNFLGLYYAMTGLHALHVFGGVLVLAYVALRRRRTAAVSTYWHFVDALWISLFVVLYLI